MKANMGYSQMDSDVFRTIGKPSFATKYKQDSLDAEEEGEQAMACLTSERRIEMSLNSEQQSAADFAERVRENQRKLTKVVCGVDICFRLCLRCCLRLCFRFCLRLCGCLCLCLRLLCLVSSYRCGG